jgi:Protein of unknown function
MTNQDRQRAALPRWRSVVPLRRPARFAVIERERRAADETPRLPRLLPLLLAWLGGHRRLIQRLLTVAAAVAGVVLIACVALWWRLSSGPIQLDVVTPWLVSAIEENFGNNHHVQVGGTQIERTESGGTAVRIRDIVVRDAEGTIVASAPKAEVRVSGMSLLSGHPRAEALNLVGAAMAVRIEEDGGVTVFAGADKHPIATAAVPVTAAAALLHSAQEKRAAPVASAPSRAGAAPAPATVPSAESQQAAARRARDVVAALLAWIDGIGETGLDGHDLRELGLKNGNLTVDDQRTGKHWTFEDISLSATRLHGGGVEVSVGSDNPARPWALAAEVTPTRQGYRRVQLEARRVSASDLLLASRFDAGSLRLDLPLSGSLSGEIGPDGLPQNLTGHVIVDAGSFGAADDEDARIGLERAELKLNWDAGNRVLAVPFQILSGGNRMTLLGQVEIPRDPGGIWQFKIGGGTVVLDAPGALGDPLVLNRIAISGRYDAGKQRVVVDEADVGNSGVGVAMSGNLDFSGTPRLAAGVAGTRMPVEAFKRIWPTFIKRKVRDWFNEHLLSGTLERIVIAVNAPLENLKESGPPLPDDALTIDALVSNCLLRPVEGLPPLRDADLTIHVVGRDAVVSLGKATADLASGKRLAMSAGVFEVPDTAVAAPPARVRFKLEGPVPAAAELLRMDRLRDVADAPFEPSAMRGNLSAQVTLGLPMKEDLPPGSTNYAISVEATNFAAERMIMGQKVEAALLRANATPAGFQLKGDVRIAGAPVSLEYRKTKGEADAEVRLQGLLDETARNNLGLDLGETVYGAIPIRLSGRVTTSAEREGRFSIDADLTPVQIDGLLPGWAKAAGKPARATFTLATKPQSLRIEDLVIEGAGSGVKGSIDLDGSGEVQAANFSSYGFSDGDRSSLRIERGGDGALRLVMRGEVYDGRGFIKSTAGPSAANASPNAKRRSVDFDLDMKLGAIVGFNGEALRAVELKMSRRAGEVRSFGMNAKIGRDATLTGDLRGRSAGRQIVHLESSDAGAFFRFTDIYTRMNGGQTTIAMEAPSADNPAQQGVLTVRNFSVHDEAQLERAVNNGTQARRNAIDFSNMRIEFNRMPGKVALREGVVRGPLLGGTIDGVVDYGRDEVHLRGTLVPLYGANNLLGQIPVVGLFMGGDKEGLLGVTYEVVGRPNVPVLRINPISALAPGILRKVFEFPTNGDSTTSDQFSGPYR